MTRSNPSAANTSANASPMPDEAPVTSATRFILRLRSGQVPRSCFFRRGRELQLEDRRGDRRADAGAHDVKPDVADGPPTDDGVHERRAKADRGIERASRNRTARERPGADGE